MLPRSACSLHESRRERERAWVLARIQIALLVYLTASIEETKSAHTNEPCDRIVAEHRSKTCPNMAGVSKMNETPALQSKVCCLILTAICHLSRSPSFYREFRGQTNKYGASCEHGLFRVRVALYSRAPAEETQGQKHTGKAKPPGGVRAHETGARPRRMDARLQKFVGVIGI